MDKHNLIYNYTSGEKMKRIICLLLVLAISTFAQKASFDLSVIYSQGSDDTRTKVETFVNKLKESLNNYDWEFPLTDFDLIENSINITLEKEESAYKFNGLITISSGLRQQDNTNLIQKRDVFFKENNAAMTIAYADEPDMTSQDVNSLENILKFYVYCTLLENFDRLSYTDNENFYLYGEKYMSKLTALSSRASGGDDNKNWESRIKLSDGYFNGEKNDERKLNALMYNAKFFNNDFKPERSVLFLPHLVNRLEKISKEAQTIFFNNYYVDLAEILRQEKDKSYLEKIKKMDPAHAKNYGK
jgi:hypothetical protein